MFPFFRDIQVFLLGDFVCWSLEISIHCFSSNFCFLLIFVPLMFAFFAFFLMIVFSFPISFSYVVFWSLYRCIDNIFKAGKPLPSSFLDTYNLSSPLWDVRLYASSWVLPSDPLKEWSRVSYERDSWGIYPFYKFSMLFFLSSFRILTRHSFFFFHLPTFNGVCF